MAHVVGVPKRDPCNKCNLPVFLAERLAVGKRVYHRTCLKCARCGSQLTPGSFYETENDGEYVCETCPDEELNNENDTGNSSPFQQANEDYDDVELRGESSAATNNSLSPPLRPVRSSIADRLAFFEQSKQPAADQKLLQKSLSDEEKSQSLKRMEQTNGTATASAAYKPSNAFSQFMHDTTDSELRAETPDVSDTTTPTGTSTNAVTHMDTSDTEGEADLDEEELNETKPKLPVTQPPAGITPKPRFTVTAALQLQQTEPEVDVPATPNSMQQKTELQMQLHDVTNNNDEHISETKPTTTLDLSVRNFSEESITKETAITEKLEVEEEKPEEKEKKRATSSMQITLSDQQKGKTEDVGDVELRERTSENPVNHDNETIERLSVVRARLQQFEVIAKTTPTSENDEKSQLSTANPQDQQKAKILINNNPDEQQSMDLEKTKANLKDDDALMKEVTAAVIETNGGQLARTNTDGQQIETKTYEQQVPLDNVAIDVDLKPSDELEKVEESKEIKVEADEEVTKLSDNKADEQSSVVATELKPEVMEVSEKIEENIEESMEHSSETNVNKMQTDSHTSEVKETLKSTEPDSKSASPQKSSSEMLAEENSTTSAVKSNISTTSTVISNISTISTTTSNGSNTLSKSSIASYPKDLDPFKSDDDDEDDAENEVLQNKENLYPVQMRTPQPRSQNHISTSATKSQASLNPFDSSDDEIELEKSAMAGVGTPGAKVPPPRPPPPRISRNPFGDEEVNDDSLSFSRRSSLNSSGTKTRTPVPTPRSNLSQSQNPTPEPTPRLSNKSAQSLRYATPANGHGDYYGSEKSLTTALTPQSSNLHRNSELRSSNNSLASSSGGTMRARKSRRAPLPPGVAASPSAASTTAPPPAKELFPSSETLNSSTSIASSPSTSTRTSPKSARKKRPAPAPPKPARLENSNIDITVTASPNEHLQTMTASKNSFSYPLQSELDSKLSDEEKALLEGKPAQMLATMNTSGGGSANTSLSRQGSRRIIPLDVSLLDDPSGSGDGDVRSDDFKTKLQQQGELENGDSHVIYRRRLLVPPKMETPTHEGNPLLEHLQSEHDRQLEKLKDNKEAQNRNRQSHASTGSSLADELESALYYNKSAHGKWKRRKGPAPALPVPARRILQMLPLQEIRQELEIIEVQQQGLEKQGVILEKMIRDRCEDEHGQPLEQKLSPEKTEQNDGSSGSGGSNSGSSTQNSKEVEDLILQLFELVNEKNELFRRQAELMYLRRQHRLEQEQADLEYEIRVLMAQPERNKTDTDKAREEALIARLVEVVQLRNDVVESLEMDRLREHEEDMSIKQRLEMHTSMRDSELGTDESKQMQKLSKKEKKKQKEVKKLKNKKLDVDKDADESELKGSEKDKEKSKKKKKKFLFIN